MENDEMRSTKLPYSVSIEVFDKILNDLKTSGGNGVSLSQLWKQIGEVENDRRSFALRLAEYLGLVEDDGSKIWLTSLGRPISFMSTEKRNIHLIKNLPESYMIMAKWILHAPNHSITPGEIKGSLTTIKPAGKVMTNLIVQSFLRYAEYIGLVNRIGRGPVAKVALTNVGLEVLSTPAAPETAPPVAKDENGNTPAVKQPQLESSSGSYPIRILTPERQFEYDIKTDKDLEVVKAVFASIENDWEAKRKQRSDIGGK